MKDSRLPQNMMGITVFGFPLEIWVGVIFSLTKFKKKGVKKCSLSCAWKGGRTPDVLCSLFQCSKYNLLRAVLRVLLSAEERPQKGCVGAWPSVYHGEWGCCVTLLPQWPCGPVGKGK